MTNRKLLALKWFIIILPPLVVAVGHSLLAQSGVFAGKGAGHAGRLSANLLVLSLFTLVALALAFLFAEALFRVLRGLQDETVAQRQEMLTLSAVMEERARFSRELHDGVAQHVAHLLLRVDTIKELIESGRQREATGELEQLRGVADEIYEEIGDSITGLRTNVTERGLAGALQDYVDQFEERHGVTTVLHIDPAVDRLPDMVGLQVFRFVQEALTNVRKHSGAEHATISVSLGKLKELTVEVGDDGRGLTPQPIDDGRARPLGLTSMRERVETLGGTFELSSQPGCGTRVTAVIPASQSRRGVGLASAAAAAR